MNPALVTILEIIEEHLDRNEQVLDHFQNERGKEHKICYYYDGKIEALIELQETLKAQLN